MKTVTLYHLGQNLLLPLIFPHMRKSLHSSLYISDCLHPSVCACRIFFFFLSSPTWRQYSMCVLTSTGQHCNTHLALHITLLSMQPKTAFIYFGSHTSLRTQTELSVTKILLVSVLHTAIKIPLLLPPLSAVGFPGQDPPHLSLLESVHCYHTAFGLCCVMVSFPLLALCHLEM